VLRVFRQAVFLALALSCTEQPVNAQTLDENDNRVNYAYAVLFGTGAYKVNDQTAFVLRLPFAYQVREATPSEPGLTLLLPVMMGYYDYDLGSAFQGELPGDAATQSFVPGIEAEYRVNPAWRLSPYGQLGVGRDLKNNENALIYVGGISSHYTFNGFDRWRFALGNSAAYLGYDPDDGGTQTFGVFAVGIDMIYPWHFSIAGRRTRFTNYLAYNWYLDTPGFEQGESSSKSVSGEAEWGLALGFAKPPRLLGVEFDRIGLGFRYGNDIKGIRLITRFPF
jgi:hypothetical protein